MHGEVNSGSKTAGFRSSEATGLQRHLSITNEGPMRMGLSRCVCAK